MEKVIFVTLPFPARSKELNDLEKHLADGWRVKHLTSTGSASMAGIGFYDQAGCKPVSDVKSWFHGYAVFVLERTSPLDEASA